MRKILTLRDFQGIGMRHFVELNTLKTHQMPPQGETTSPRVQPRIRQGKWVCVCPFCPEVIMLDDQELVFYCLNYECNNGAVGHRWIPVTPLPKDRSYIEETLLKRLQGENMNWEPHETVEDLIRQNKERGIV